MTRAERQRLETELLRWMRSLGLLEEYQGALPADLYVLQVSDLALSACADGETLATAGTRL
jgi:hypothetical protein